MTFSLLCATQGETYAGMWYEVHCEQWPPEWAEISGDEEGLI